jgi:hypothetical protein
VALKLSGPISLLASFYLAAKTLGVGPVPPKRRPHQPQQDVPDLYRLADGLVGYAEVQQTPRIVKMAQSAVETAEVQLGKELCAGLRDRIDALKM